jgi:hypothetical protein
MTAYSGPWYHGTTAILETDDLITTGHESNFDQSHRRKVYFTPVLGWAVFYAVTVAEPGQLPRVYEVKPTAARTFRDNGRWYGGISDRRARWSSQPLAVIREIPVTPGLLRRASRLISLMENAVRELEQG